VRVNRFTTAVYGIDEQVLVVCETEVRRKPTGATVLGFESVVVGEGGSLSQDLLFKLCDIYDSGNA